MGSYGCTSLKSGYKLFFQNRGRIVQKNWELIINSQFFYFELLSFPPVLIKIAAIIPPIINKTASKCIILINPQLNDKRIAVCKSCAKGVANTRLLVTIAWPENGPASTNTRCNVVIIAVGAPVTFGKYCDSPA